MMMKAWKSVAAACALAVGALSVTSDDADARHRWRHHHRGGDAIAGAAIGFAAGALLSGAIAPRYGSGYGYGYRHRPYYGYGYRPYHYGGYYDYAPGYYVTPGVVRVPRYRTAPVYYRSGLSAHQQRCLARYRTYDVASDTYVANSRGERRYCRL